MIMFWRWVGTSLQIIGSIMLAIHVPWSGAAYIFLIPGALIWLMLAMMGNDRALATLNCGFVMINIVGMGRWLLVP